MFIRIINWYFKRNIKRVIVETALERETDRQIDRQRLASAVMVGRGG